MSTTGVYTFSAACSITVQIMLSIGFFIVSIIALVILMRVIRKPSEIAKNLLKEADGHSFIAPLFYFLVMLHNIVMCIYLAIFTAQVIEIYNRNDGIDEIGDADGRTLLTTFNNGLYIGDAIFFLVFIILFTQMIIYNEYAHFSKGAQFNNLLTKRTYQMPFEAKVTLVVYSLIQLVIVILYNSIKANVDEGTIRSRVLNSIDLFLNITQPLMQIIYEIYTNRRFQGCPIKSKKMEQQIRQLRAILIFMSVGRAVECIINICLISNFKFFFVSLTNTNIQAYILIGLYALEEILFQIIPFVLSFDKQIQKIMLMTFEQNKLIQLDQEVTEIQNTNLEDSSLDQKAGRRYTLSDMQQRSIIELKPNEFTIGDVFTMPSVSAVQLGQLNKSKLLNQKYLGRQFMCRRISSNRLSQYMIEEINSDLQNHRKLNNPYVLSIKALTIDSEYIYFFMHYFEDGSLGGLVSGKTSIPEVSLDTKMTFLKNICEGMQYLHKQGIYHGSLKSNNIMLAKNNQAKIVDFGLSALKKFISLTTGYTLKTQYSAPEILMERSATPEATAQADIYAFGMITWEIYHMRQAFPALSVSELQKLISQEQKRPKIDEAIPEDIKYVIRQAWQQEATKRPSFDKIHSFLNGTTQSLD